MGTFKWVLAGAMSLIVIELVTRNTRTGDAVGGALAGVATMTRRFLDPTVPAFGERIDLGGEHAVGTMPGSTYPNPSRPNLGGN